MPSRPQLQKTAMKLLKVSLVLALFLMICLSTVQAETLESSSFIIQFGNFNVTSGEKSGATYNVTDTVGQTGAGPYGEFGTANYFVGGGFQYIYPLDRFRFTISKTDIDLGELTAFAHNTDTNVLTITAPTAGGYQIYAYEQHPLKLSVSSATIADTTCDNNDCDQTVAKIWQDTSVGGFGFNVNGTDKATDFTNTNFFRQFADNALSEPMQLIMSNSGYSVDRTATVTYKAGLSGSEPAGRYDTAIIFVAVPAY